MVLAAYVYPILLRTLHDYASAYNDALNGRFWRSSPYVECPFPGIPDILRIEAVRFTAAAIHNIWYGGNLGDSIISL